MATEGQNPVDAAQVPPLVISSGSSGAKVPVPVSVILEPSTANAHADLLITHSAAPLVV
jgi:hypothetical protein